MSLLAKIPSRILLCAWLLALVPAAGARAELIVVANEHAGTLSIIDGETGGARTLTVGGDPHNLAVTAGGGRVIVTHPSAGRVSVIDPRLPKVLKRLAVPGRPHGVAVGPDDRWAFIGAETGRRLYRLDLAKLELAGAFALSPAPHNLAVTATGRAWITVQGGSTLWLVDLGSGAPVHRLDTPAMPHDLALSRQGGALWVTNWGSPDVFLVQGDPPRLLTVKIGGREAHHVALTPDGAGAWITNHGSEDISVIDTARRREVARIAVGDAPHHVAFSRDGRWAYVANSGSNDVSVIDVAARREVRRLRAGAHPHGIVTIPGNVATFDAPDLQSAEADFAHSAEAVTSAAKAGRSAKADGGKGRGFSALQ